MKQHFNINIVFLRKYEILIASTLVIITVIILTYIFLIPNIYKATKMSNDQKSLRIRISSLKKKDNNLSSIDFTKYSNALPKVYKVLPLTKDYVSFFLRFDELQSNTGITLDSTTFQLGVISSESATINKTDSAYEIPVTMQVTGNYRQMQNFIEALTDLSGRLITLNNVDWRINGNTITAGYLGKSYYNPISRSVIAITAPVIIIDKNKEEILNNIIKKQIHAGTDEINTEDIKVGKKNIFN